MDVNSNNIYIYIYVQYTYKVQYGNYSSTAPDVDTAQKTFGGRHSQLVAVAVARRVDHPNTDVGGCTITV